MATPVTISSNALLLLGADSINSFSEPFDRAKLASNLWPEVRDWLLRSHPWNCATARAALAPDSTPPVFDYAFQFSLPDGWLKTLQVGELGIPVDFKTEGLKILSDENPLNLVYIFRQAEGAWDSQLTWAGTVAMAAAMAYAITQSASVQNTWFTTLGQILRAARTADGQDDPPQTMGDFRLLASRFTSTIPITR
jgi:hypothetical protein